MNHQRALRTPRTPDLRSQGHLFSTLQAPDKAFRGLRVVKKPLMRNIDRCETSADRLGDLDSGAQEEAGPDRSDHSRGSDRAATGCAGRPRGPVTVPRDEGDAVRYAEWEGSARRRSGTWSSREPGFLTL